MNCTHTDIQPTKRIPFGDLTNTILNQPHLNPVQFDIPDSKIKVNFIPKPTREGSSKEINLQLVKELLQDKIISS